MMKFRYIPLWIFLSVLVITFGSMKDEDLTPETRSAIHRMPSTAPPDQNAFVGIAGFNAPETEDFLTAGQNAILSMTRGKHTRDDRGYPNDLVAAEVCENPCFTVAETTCLTALEQDARRVDHLLEGNAERIRRYRRIQDMPLYVYTGLAARKIRNRNQEQWLSMLGAASEVPDYIELMKISELLSAAAFLDINHGNVDKGLDFIEMDMDFYRRMFTGKDAGLLELRVARNRIENYALGVSKLIEAGALDLQVHGDRLRRILDPIADPFTHAATAVETDSSGHLQIIFDKIVPFQTQDGTLAFENRSSLFLYSFPLTYRKNMTLNQMNARAEETARRIRTMDFQSFPDQVKALWEERKKSDTKKISSFNIPLLYQRNGIFFWKNYMGELFMTADDVDVITHVAKNG
ncbi:hypothetical protein LJC47_05615 [Desulfosarcina sp. OttesenSCG-928-B08]|nr:hypothetical protein [Desulfosarcina sp. OttesenSCG-928-B08]